MEGLLKWLESKDGQHSLEGINFVFEALIELGTFKKVGKYCHA
jgi:hypothetical protein